MPRSLNRRSAQQMRQTASGEPLRQLGQPVCALITEKNHPSGSTTPVSRAFEKRQCAIRKLFNIRYPILARGSCPGNCSGREKRLEATPTHRRSDIRGGCGLSGRGPRPTALSYDDSAPSTLTMSFTEHNKTGASSSRLSAARRLRGRWRRGHSSRRCRIVGLVAPRSPEDPPALRSIRKGLLL